MPVQCTCRRCGAVYAVVPAQVKRGRAKYCSRSCADAARREHVACVCDQCGGAFSLKPSMANRGVKAYCSRRCYFAAKKHQARPLTTATCRCCGSSFSLAAWRVEKGEGQFCSRVCRDLGAHIARRDPPGVRLSTRYYGWSWRDAQRDARERDGRCVDCGITPSEIGRALDVHHIVPFKRFGSERHQEANLLTNLVALCQPCHIRREWATNWRPQ